MVAPEFSPQRRHAGWRPYLFPLLTMIVGVGLIYFVRTIVFEREWLSPANVNVATLVLFGVMLIVLGLWMWRWAPFSRRTRLAVVCTEIAVIAALMITLRIDGVSGNLLPRLVWRWSSREHTLLPAASSEAAAGIPIVLQPGPNDSPQFLGPSANATLPGPPIAHDWQKSPPREIWRRTVGAGWSSFAIVGGYAVTQEQRGEAELITCYSIVDGSLQWSHAEQVRFSERLGGEGPRATPTIRDGKVYAVGATGILNCLDGSTGQQVWRHDLLAETGAKLPMYGIAVSPLVLEDVVVVSIGGPNGNSLLAFEQDTGNKVWSAGSDPISYCSPTLLTLHGTPQIVVVNAAAINSHDPADGRILWTMPWPEAASDPHASQPVELGQNRLLVSMAYSVGAMAFQVHHDGSGAWSADRLWSERVMRTKLTTPILHDGYVYGLDEGFLQCIDPNNGRRMWRKSRSQEFGHGQVLLVGDLLLIQAEEPGDLILVEPSPEEHRELARMSALEGKSWNYPALSGRMLLMRNSAEAVCFELPAE